MKKTLIQKLGLLAALSLLLLPGCAPSGARDRAPVQPLTCT